MTNLVKDAIDCAGGVISVSKALGLSRISIYEWIEKGTLPASRVIAVSKLGGFKVTPHRLAPTLYPNESDGLPSTEQVSA